jgi:hypothetical protein
MYASGGKAYAGESQLAELHRTTDTQLDTK